ncbi:sulfotransferase [soil metagenome]
MTDRYPNFFIVGAAKAGTTSLYEYLRASPGVYMRPIKEPSFFSPDAVKNPGTHQRVVDWDGYLRLFAGTTGEIAIGGASPSYLWDRQFPRLIREKIPDAKIIIVLRDPVDRAYSHYLAEVRLGWQEMPFLEALQADAHQAQKGWGISRFYLELGEYSEQVARYLETFGQDAVTVLLFDDLRQNTHRCVSELLQFLGVPDAGTLGGVLPVYNVYAAPRGPLAKLTISNTTVRGLARRCVPAALRAWIRDTVLLKRGTIPPMSSEARVFLEEYYRADMRRLEALLGRRLPWRWLNA